MARIVKFYRAVPVLLSWIERIEVPLVEGRTTTTCGSTKNRSNTINMNYLQESYYDEFDKDFAP
jgi:hypothetical protein